MRNGHFRAGTTITFAVHNKKHYLINGQHTLHAIVAYGEPVMLTLEDYPVVSEHDIASLYATFDRNLSRSQNDIFHAHGLAQATGLQKAEIASVAAALPYVLSGFEENGRMSVTPIGSLLKDAESRYAHVLTWIPEAKDYAQCVRGATTVIRLMLQRAAVTAVALVTLRHQPAQAAAFWSLVAMDDGLASRAPAKTLLTFLYATPAVTLRSARYCRYVAAAWNAYVTERPLHKLYARDLGKPMLIDGTPHDGEDVWEYVSLDGAPLHLPVKREEE